MPKGLWRNREEAPGTRAGEKMTGTDENGEVDMRNQAERALDAIVSNLFFVLLNAIENFEGFNEKMSGLNCCL